MNLKEKVISEIKKIYDPEIPVNIYELGLIYDILIKDKGYDVSMLFVETSVKTALERNRLRKERSLLDKIVERNHEAVQGNKPGFKEMFGDRFMEVKTDNLKIEDAMPKKLVDKMNDFVSGYEKITNPSKTAKNLIEKQKTQKKKNQFCSSHF